MSNHTQSMRESTVLSLLDDLQKLSVAARNVREKLLHILPSKYGSDLWWEKSDKEALESIRAGKGKRFKTYEEAVKYLTS